MSLHYKEEKVQSPDYKYRALGPHGTGSQDLSLLLSSVLDKPAREGGKLAAALPMLLHGLGTRAVWRMLLLPESS